MKDTIILTQIYPEMHIPNGNYAPMLDLVKERHTRYAELHGYEYRPTVSWVNNKLNPFLGIWARVEFIRNVLLEGYKNVMWLDVDAVIVDMTADITEVCKGIGAVPDKKIGSFCHVSAPSYLCGVLYFENTPRVREFMEDWLAGYPGGLWGTEMWWETTVFNQLVYSEKYKGLIHDIPDKWQSYSNTWLSDEQTVVRHFATDTYEGKMRGMKTLIDKLNREGR